MVMSQEDTQFKDGHSGGPGRPKGSRNKLSEAFILALSDDFIENGVETIQQLRENQPVEYVKVIGRLMPKLMELSGPEGMPIDTDWTIEIIQPKEPPKSE